jgi:hypothetical protein
MDYSKIEHVGNGSKRREWNYREEIFAAKWEEENKRLSFLNGGYGVLESLLDEHKEKSIYGPVSEISQRDAFVSATVIQWLGSNVGQCFLRECSKKIEIGREKSDREKNVVKSRLEILDIV